MCKALRLSPRDDFASQWMLTAGAAKLHLRADEEAVVWLGRSIESDRNWPLAHFFLVAALANQQAQRCAGGDPGRARSRSNIHNPTLPRRGRDRRREFHVDSRALLCRHAQGRNPRRMTATRRLNLDKAVERRRFGFTGREVAIIGQGAWCIE